MWLSRFFQVFRFLQTERGENAFSGYRNECAAVASVMNSFMILTIRLDREYFIPFIESTISHIQENERSRISRDLHDTVTQDTRASLLLVHKLQRMDRLSENQKFLIQNIRTLEETNLRNIKSTIKNLTPPEIEIAKIEKLLDEYAQSIKETKGIACKFYAEKKRFIQKSFSKTETAYLPDYAGKCEQIHKTRNP